MKFFFNADSKMHDIMMNLFYFSEKYADFLAEITDFDEIDSCLKSNIINETLISSKYLFVFLTDEYFCEHYINAKVLTYLKLDIIPVLMSLSNRYQMILPKNSYINVAQFTTAKHLIQYLQYLQKNPGIKKIRLYLIIKYVPSYT